MLSDGFNFNDTSYTVLLGTSVVTGKFEFDWIMISNVSATWYINHNLNAGGLIIECADDVGDIISPENITLTSPNSATVLYRVSA